MLAKYAAIVVPLVKCACKIARDCGRSMSADCFGMLDGTVILVLAHV